MRIFHSSPRNQEGTLPARDSHPAPRVSDWSEESHLQNQHVYFCCPLVYLFFWVQFESGTVSGNLVEMKSLLELFSSDHEEQWWLLAFGFGFWVFPGPLGQKGRSEEITPQSPSTAGGVWLDSFSALSDIVTRQRHIREIIFVQQFSKPMWDSSLQGQHGVSLNETH